MRYYSSVAQPTTLSSGLAAASPGTVATFTSADVPTGYPSSYPFTIAINEGLVDEELCEVTDISGSTWTVTRGVDGSTPTDHTSGATITHVSSARDFQEPQNHIAASSAVHGLTGSVVGTTDTQALTNKTIDAGTNTLIIPESAVTNLVSDLAGKASLGTNDFTGGAAQNINGATRVDLPIGYGITNDSVALTLTGNNINQTGDMLSIQSPTTGTIEFRVDVNGVAIANAGVHAATVRAGADAYGDTSAAPFRSQTSDATQPAAVFKAAASQSASVVQVLNNSGSSMFDIASDGTAELRSGATFSGGTKVTHLTYGSATGTTDANGLLTITHGLGTTPTGVQLTVKEGWGTAVTVQLVSVSSTSIVVRLDKVSDGSNLANASGGAIYWEAKA